MNNTNTGSKILIAIVILLFILVTESCEQSTDKEKIQNQINSINGEVISIDKNTLHIGDPFTFDSKYDDIYKITYKVNGETKDGWVRFRTFSTDWKLD